MNNYKSISFFDDLTKVEYSMYVDDSIFHIEARSEDKCRAESNDSIKRTTTYKGIIELALSIDDIWDVNEEVAQKLASEALGYLPYIDHGSAKSAGAIFGINKIDSVSKIEVIAEICFYIENNGALEAVEVLGGSVVSVAKAMHSEGLPINELDELMNVIDDIDNDMMTAIEKHGDVAINLIYK